MDRLSHGMLEVEVGSGFVRAKEEQDRGDDGQGGSKWKWSEATRSGARRLTVA